MARLRKFIPMVTLILLVGLTTTTLETLLGCPDEPASFSCNEQCCLQCTTLHNMSLQKSWVVSNPEMPPAVFLSLFDFSVHPDPLLAGIERPPIPLLS